MPKIKNLTHHSKLRELNPNSLVYKSINSAQIALNLYEQSIKVDHIKTDQQKKLLASEQATKIISQIDTEVARGEYNLEAFYRFAFFTGLDTTFSYQSVINPALTREIDRAFVFSLRIRAVF